MNRHMAKPIGYYDTIFVGIYRYFDVQEIPTIFKEHPWNLDISKKMNRTEIVNIIYSYIKENNLDPNNIKCIIPDENIKKLFNLNNNIEISYSELNSYINEIYVKHRESKIYFKYKTPIILQEYPWNLDICKVINEEDVVKLIFKYIKENNLATEKSRKRQIICDKNLKKLFNLNINDNRIGRKYFSLDAMLMKEYVSRIIYGNRYDVKSWNFLDFKKYSQTVNKRAIKYLILGYQMSKSSEFRQIFVNEILSYAVEVVI